MCVVCKARWGNAEKCGKDTLVVLSIIGGALEVNYKLLDPIPIGEKRLKYLPYSYIHTQVCFRIKIKIAVVKQPFISQQSWQEYTMLF